MRLFIIFMQWQVRSFATNVFNCLTRTLRMVLCCVYSMMMETTNFLSKSTRSSQSCPLSSIDFYLGALVLAVASHRLKNYSCPCFRSFPSIHQLSLGGPLCRHLYLPRVSATWQPNNICPFYHTTCSLDLHLDPTDALLHLATSNTSITKETGMRN